MNTVWIATSTNEELNQIHVLATEEEAQRFVNLAWATYKLMGSSVEPLWDIWHQPISTVEAALASYTASKDLTRPQTLPE